MLDNMDHQAASNQMNNYNPHHQMAQMNQLQAPVMNGGMQMAQVCLEFIYIFIRNLPIFRILLSEPHDESSRSRPQSNGIPW